MAVCEPSVQHVELPVRDPRQPVLVGDDDEGRSELRMEVGEQIDDLLAGAAVEIAGRLVAEQ